MSNRKQRRKMASQFPPNARKSMTQLLKEAAEKKRNERAGDAERAAHQADPTPAIIKAALVTQKPSTQDIGQATIQWTWQTNRYRVVANYWLIEPNIESVPAGSYTVRIDLEDDYTFTPEESRELGIIMLSATEWSTNWQQHMGEFLMVKPSEKPDLQVIDGYEDSKDSENKDIFDDVTKINDIAEDNNQLDASDE
jgi:hypothetical protein